MKRLNAHENVYIGLIVDSISGFVTLKVKYFNS